MIPESTLAAIERYVERRTPTGSFLRAVLENNLVEAINRADAENGKVLREIVSYVYWKIPAICWGSPAKVKKWLEDYQEKKKE